MRYLSTHLCSRLYIERIISGNRCRTRFREARAIASSVITKREELCLVGKPAREKILSGRSRECTLRCIVSASNSRRTSSSPSPSRRFYGPYDQRVNNAVISRVAAHSCEQFPRTIRATKLDLSSNCKNGYYQPSAITLIVARPRETNFSIFLRRCKPATPASEFGYRISRVDDS